MFGEFLTVARSAMSVKDSYDRQKDIDNHNAMAEIHDYYDQLESGREDDIEVVK